jgi:hypothetical protein
MSRPLTSSYRKLLNPEVIHITSNKIFDIFFGRLILASFRIRAYGRARARKALYYDYCADVAQLVEQRIRNA